MNYMCLLFCKKQHISDMWDTPISKLRKLIIYYFHIFNLYIKKIIKMADQR